VILPVDKVKGECIWITDIDTIEEDPDEVMKQIDFTLNLSSWCDSQIAGENHYAHISIPDGAGSYLDFKQAVDIALERIQNDEEVLIHCAAGVSRSVAVATTVVACRRETGFEDELGRVKSSRNSGINPAPALRRYGQRYVENYLEGRGGTVYV